MSSLGFGIFAIKITQLLLLFCLVAALAIAQLVAWRKKVKIADASLQIVLAALIAARLAFVAIWFEQYRAMPLSMLDIRDGGFDVTSGLVAGAVLSAWHGWRQASLRTPLAAGTLTFLLAWIYISPSVHSLARDIDMPAATIRTFDGRQVRLQELANGRPMVVNLWASWCPPCRREMPILVNAHGQRKNLAFVFVNEDSDLTAALRFMQEENVPPDMTVADPKGELMRAFRAGALPTTLFFSADGKLASVHVGALAEATLESELQKLGK
jgi:thiol-disulfide isomerase/thioredoxin